jgi:hypothetical protein
VHQVTESDSLGVGKKPTILLSSANQVIKGSDPWFMGVSRFLVVSSGGRLLMVKWNHGWGKYRHDDISAFEVFEADLQMSRWSGLSSIGDQALFVSETI